MSVPPVFGKRPLCARTGRSDKEAIDPRRCCSWQGAVGGFFCGRFIGWPLL
jgi:hypothetical protein